MNFFSFLLLQSPTFDWAKEFLQSSAWNYFGTADNGNGPLFSLPNECLSVTLTACSNFEQTSSIVLELLEDDQDNNLDNSAKMSTPKKRKSGAKGKAPLSEDEVRRSTRLKKQNKGFKSSSYKDRNFLGCSSTPPTISTKVIRNLGASFCGLNPEDLSPSKLNANPKKAPIAKKQTKKKRSFGDRSSAKASEDEEASSGPQ